MTMKGLIFGDSHAGMLVEALDLPQPGPEAPITLDFFGKPGSGPRGFEIRGSRVVATDPRLVAFLDKINAPGQPDLSGYDFVIIAGCGVSIYATVQTASKCALVGSGRAAHLARRHRPGDLAPLKHHLVSTEGFRQTIRDRLRGKLAFSILGTLSHSFDLPIFMVPQPRPRILLKDMHRKGKGFADAVKFADAALISRAFDDAARTIIQEIAPCRYLAQPAATIEDHIFTADRFCKGALRLSNPGMAQNRRDVMHTNAQYGQLVLRQIRKTLNRDSGT